jgi:hypothetical protein
MTFFFLMVILGSTAKKAAPGFALIAIGLCLTLIHLICCIPVTNTSVNPACSTGPTRFVGGWALSQLWLFWVAPLIGAAMAGFLFPKLEESFRSRSKLAWLEQTRGGADTLMTLGAAMTQEIRPEDLIVTEQDGTRRINHDVIESYGLFNLPRATMRQALMVYYDNASRQGRGPAQIVRTFITLASSITRFPRQVAINFTRGVAYRRNMRMLRRFSR